MGPCDLIDRVIELTDYMEYLEKGENFEMRRENVLELTTFAQEQQSGGKAASMKRVTVPSPAPIVTRIL